MMFLPAVCLPIARAHLKREVRRLVRLSQVVNERVARELALQVCEQKQRARQPPPEGRVARAALLVAEWATR